MSPSCRHWPGNVHAGQGRLHQGLELGGGGGIDAAAGVARPVVADQSAQAVDLIASADSWLSPIGFATVANSPNSDAPQGSIHHVHDSPVTNPNPPFSRVDA
jgi:hypothetical protein